VSRRVQVIIDEPFVLRVVIPSARTPVVIFGRIGFLTLWAWVWVAAVPPIEDWWRLAVALTAWSVVSLLALSSLLWHLRGAEIVDIREGTLRLIRIGGGWTQQRVYPLSEVRHWRVTPRGVAFDTAKETVTFGDGLDAEEADLLVRRLLR
jgi:hypothetical protein